MSNPDPFTLERQVINTGSAANDGTGDSSFVWSRKCNENFQVLFDRTDQLNSYTATANQVYAVDVSQVGGGQVGYAARITTDLTLEGALKMGGLTGWSGQLEVMAAGGGSKLLTFTNGVLTGVA